MISHNLDKVAKIIGGVAKDADFAGVVALTRTAKLIQAVVKEKAKKKFLLKNSWVLRGIKITSATKTKIEAEIFTLDQFLAIQDAGGSRSSDREFLVPGRNFKKITGVNPKSKVIPKKYRRSALLNKTSFPIKKKATTANKSSKKKRKTKGRARPFEFTSKAGDKFIGVRRSSGSRPLGILYLRIDLPVKIHGRQFFEKPADKEYDAKFQAEYDKAFEQFVKVKL